MLSDTHLYKQCGNSVTVNVIEGIAKEIIREENPGLVYEYEMENPVKLYLNYSDVDPDTDVSEFNRMKNKL